MSENIGSGNVLSPVRYQVITTTIAEYNIIDILEHIVVTLKSQLRTILSRKGIWKFRPQSIGQYEGIQV